MDLKSIHEIFTNRILRIPAYQRGYAWTNNKSIKVDNKEPLKNMKGQLKDLWDDLINIPEGKCAICAMAIEIQFFMCGGEKIKTQKGRQ